MGKSNVLHILASFGIGGIEVLCREYARFSTHSNYFLTIYSEGEVGEVLRREGFYIKNLGTSNSHIYTTFQAIKHECKSCSINTIIVHHPITMIELLLPSLKKALPCVKILVYAHSNACNMVRVYDKRGLAIRKAILQRAFNCADLIIAISKSVEISLKEYFKVRTSIRVIYNGVDVIKFTPRMPFDTTSRRKIIFVGRLIEIKGVQVILKVMSKMTLETRMKFLIVGDGPHKKLLETLVQTYGLKEHVVFFGALQNVSDLLKQADIFVHYPLIEEGFGITVIEAMASGLICVCGARGGIREIIDNQKNGFLVDSEERLRTTLEYILNDADEKALNAMQQEAIAKAESFSIKRFAKALDKEVRHALH